MSKLKGTKTHDNLKAAFAGEFVGGVEAELGADSHIGGGVTRG